MKKLFPALALVWMMSFSALGQNSVGINTSTPNSKAVLELVSPNNNQGFLVPRMTTPEREAMGLTGADQGMMVYDIQENQFWHWDGGIWKPGLGVLGDTEAGGDLEGVFPNATIRANAVDSDELADVATSVGAFGAANDSTVLEITIDEDGRVRSVTEKGVRVGSINILDASILGQDIASSTITISKIDGEGNPDRVLVTGSDGIPFWEDRNAFVSTDLADGSILIGSSTNIAEAQPVGGDLNVTNSGTEAEFVIADNAVTNRKVQRASLQPDRILGLPSDVDLLTGRGIFVAQSATVTIDIPGVGPTPYWVGGFQPTSNSSVVVTDANGSVTFEPRSSFELTTLQQGRVFYGTATGTEQLGITLDATRGGFVIGGAPGTGAITAQTIKEDVFIFSDGRAQIQDNAVQGDDIDATSGALNIAGTFPISLSTTSTSTQAIQLNSTLGSIDIDGNQGVAIDATNNDVNIAAASGNVNITGNSFTNLLSNADINIVANNDLDISTVTGIVSMTSADALDLIGGATSSFTTTFGDIDINAAFQLDLDGVNVAMDATDAINITAGTGAATMASTAGEVDLTAGTTVDINATGGNVSIDAEGAGDDVVITANDLVSINGANTQVTSGTFQLNTGATVTDVTTILDATGDDLTIPTEKAVRDALNFSVTAENGLTEVTQGNIRLGGDLTTPSTVITQGAGEAFTISNAGDANTTIELLNTGDFVVDGQTGDIIVDQTGLLTLENGVTVSGGTVDLGNDAIQTAEISDDAVTVDKLGTGGAADKVFITDAAGNPFLEDISVLGLIALPEGNIYRGDNGGSPIPYDASADGFFLVGDGTTVNSVDVSGDIDIDNTGDAQIQAGVVTTAEIFDETITANDIGMGAVDTDEIATDAVTALEIATDAVTTDEIDDGTILEVDLADNSVTLSKLGTNTGTDQNKVYTTDGSGNPIFEDRANFATSTLAQGSVFVGNISGVAAGVDASTDGYMLVGDGTTVNSVEIQGDISINNAGVVQIEPDVVTTAEIDDGTIGTADIANNAITEPLIDANAVTATQIATGAVNTDEIAAGAVTSTQIANGTILEADISGNAITSALIADNAVTTTEIANGTIATADVANNAITTDKLGTAGGGDANKVFTTNGAGDPQLEDRTNFTSSVLPEGSIYIGDGSNVASNVDASGNGFMLVGNGSTLNSVEVTGDIDINTSGLVTIQDDAVTNAKVADNAIGSTQVINNSLTADDINTGAVTTDEILNGTILTGDIANDQITSALIANDAVGNTEISSNAVDTDEIATGAVTTIEILNGTILTGDIDDDAITSAKIATDAVAADEIADAAVNTGEIADGAVEAQDLANGAVSTDKIADDAVTLAKLGTGGANQVFTTDGGGNPQLEPRSNFASSVLSNGQIYVGDATNVAVGRTLGGDATISNTGVLTISGDAVESAEIVDRSIAAVDIGTDVITATEIGPGAVTTSEISDGTIATVDIAANAIDATLIANDAVGSTEIATNAVTTTEILDGTIAAVDIGTDVITASEIATNAVTTTEIADGTIAAADIGSDVITAGEIATGAVTTDEILDGTIATVDIGDDQVNLDKLATGAANQVFTTDGAGNPQFEARSNFASSTLNQGNIFIGNGSNVATGVNVSGNGQMLIGNGTTINSVDISGDIDIDNTGDAQIQADAVTATEIATDAVTTIEIDDGTIATVDIANNAITSGLIADDAVGSTEIATNAVTTTEIADGTIAAVDIGSDVITAGEIATGAVTTDEILDGTIATVDIGDDQVNLDKLATGAADQVFTTDGAGNP